MFWSLPFSCACKPTKVGAEAEAKRSVRLIKALGLVPPESLFSQRMPALSKAPVGEGMLHTLPPRPTPGANACTYGSVTVITTVAVSQLVGAASRQI